MKRARRVAACVAVLLGSGRAPATAQRAAAPTSLDAQKTAPASVQDTQAYRLQAVHGHPHQTVVAVALRLHAGSQDDEAGREGTAWLLGRVLEAEATRTLLDMGSEAAVTVSVERATTLITVLAFPEDWKAAWAAVDAVVFDAPLDPALVEDRRGALLERLTFEAGSPVQDFETEAAGLLAEPGSPYARPRRGTSTTLAALTPADVARYRGAHVRRATAVQAVVGPVQTAVRPADRDTTGTAGAPGTAAAPDTTDTTVAPGTSDLTGTPDTTVAGDAATVAATSVTPVLPSPPPGGLAWRIGDRRTQVQDVTSTWIEVAYPAPAGLPRTRLELIAHLLEEELDPTPPDPDQYSVAVRLQDTPGGPVLVVEAAVFPEATARWEERITGAVRRLAREPIPPDFFSWRRRRFRTARLLEEGAPEAEAARMTADLLRQGTVRNLALEIWGLDAAAVGEAARSLGEPRIFILGPDLGGAPE